MSRPTEHGGGGGAASAPVAGDPSSFPDDAELARTLVAGRTRGSLATLTADGFPFGSVVSYALDGDGAPVVLISDMAEHTVNAIGDERASLLVTAEVPAGTDPLAVGRCTLVGRLRPTDDPARVRDDYLRRHPGAELYVEFSDFRFWTLAPEQCRFVGGFGRMSWVPIEAYRSAVADPVADRAEAIVAHMNDDHSDANLTYVRALAGLAEATTAQMTAIDRRGVTLEASTPDGPRLARLAFPQPLETADDARPAVVALLETARRTGA